MQIQYINEMLQIPEVRINQIQFMNDNEIHIEAVPVAQKQCCPICQSDEYVIRKGSNDLRKVRHLPAFDNRVYLQVSSIRMRCTRCEAGFVWVYDFVGPKKHHDLWGF